MPASNVAAEKRSQPQILVETAGLSEEEWLAYRRKGIGGSDVAALLGISPWRTARDLYFDKLNIVEVEDNEDNWVALEMGHLLESLVAKIFQHRTGYKVYQIKKCSSTHSIRGCWPMWTILWNCRMAVPQFWRLKRQIITQGITGG